MKLIAVTAGLAFAVAMLAGCGTNTRTVIKEPGPRVTVTVTATPRTIVKTVTRTVSGPAGVPCAELPDGSVTVFPHGALGNATSTTCTITVIGPDAAERWQATAPDGSTVDFTVGP
jgi:hypothetical protein